MPPSPDTVSMAMFCDFENVALGVRDAKYDKFDIKPVLERLLLKGSIVVKKAYCDWERYKGFKAAMHEANFELIEIPHVRQSGKNSADIRMVVDALDLCYTKAHVNTFVIVSGDSDFSPLVSKLRENAKYVIGVGIKQSTSDLLIANCDEFIFYDDLVRESQRSAVRRDPNADAPFAKRSSEELEARRSEAVELAASTFDALVVERGDSSRIWASMLKEAIKRRRPDFNESHFGFRAFGNLLDAAQTRGLFEVGRDEKSGAYVFRSTAPAAQPEGGASHEAGAQASVEDNGAGRRNRPWPMTSLRKPRRYRSKRARRRMHRPRSQAPCGLQRRWRARRWWRPARCPWRRPARVKNDVRVPGAGAARPRTRRRRRVPRSLVWAPHAPLRSPSSRPRPSPKAKRRSRHDRHAKPRPRSPPRRRRMPPPPWRRRRPRVSRAPARRLQWSSPETRARTVTAKLRDGEGGEKQARGIIFPARLRIYRG